MNLIYRSETASPGSRLRLLLRSCHIIILLLFVSCASGKYSVLQDTQSPWELVWSDEFNYRGLPDERKWNYDVGGHGWGNGELQYYTEADLHNVRVKSGMLHITARKAEDQLPPDTWAFYKNYTSARLVTRETARWTYGRFEIRAKLPPGVGLWPAIWMLSADNRYGNWPASGEIDIMEHVGFEPTLTHNAIHTRAFNHLRNTQKTADNYVDPYQFHTYALEWYPDTLLFFVDEQPTMEFRNPQDGRYEAWPYDHPFYLIMNIAVGGSWGGLQGVDDEIFPATMKVDFVRVYRKNKAP